MQWADAVLQCHAMLLSHRLELIEMPKTLPSLRGKGLANSRVTREDFYHLMKGAYSLQRMSLNGAVPRRRPLRGTGSCTYYVHGSNGSIDVSK